jgi:hypothetical protein
MLSSYDFTAVGLSMLPGCFSEPSLLRYLEKTIKLNINELISKRNI